MEQTIDVSRRSAESANRLRALFEASAGAARAGGGESEEEFLLGMAALMDSFLKQRIETTGEDMPEPLTLGGQAGGISTDELTRDDCGKGARLLSLAADRLHGEGYRALATFLVQVGLALGQIGAAKARPENNSVIQ